MASSSSGRKRSTQRQNSAEDQALSQIHTEAESRLAQNRAVRAEARDIRTRELERQRREEEEKEKEKEKEKEGKSDRVSELKKDYATSRYLPNGSRRGSFETSEDGVRDVKRELYDLEDKYKKAMMTNAHLDNEKQSLRYQADLLRDQVDDMTEHNTELHRELRDKTRQLELLKRDFAELETKCKACEEQCRQRDALIQEHGLVFVSDDTLADGAAAAAEASSESEASSVTKSNPHPPATLLSTEIFDTLKGYSGTLEERIQKLSHDKKAVEKEARKLRQDLEDDRDRRSIIDKYSHSPRSSTPLSNGPTDSQSSDSDTQKELGEYKLRLKRAEQEITTLEGNIVRLENQVKRFKTAAETLEKSEEELKAEKRKFQKDLRAALAEKEDLEMQNSLLQKRLDKSKTPTTRGSFAK